MGLPVRWLRRLLAFAAFVAGAGLAVVVARQGPAPAAPVVAPVPPSSVVHRLPPIAGSAELGLLAPLVVGSDLGGFAVREIHPVEHGVLRLVCAREKEVVYLDVALTGVVDGGGEGPLPPATAGRYAVFYKLDGAAPEDGERLARLLARLIEKSAAPTPPGLTTFAPAPRPPITL